MAAVFDFDDQDPDVRERRLSNASNDLVFLADEEITRAGLASVTITEAEKEEDDDELNQSPAAANKNHNNNNISAPRSPSVSVSMEQFASPHYEVDINSTYISSDAPKLEKKKPSDFQPLKVLGQGAYGKVLLVKEKTSGRLFAQKQFKKASMVVEKRRIEQTKTERSILESLRHPFIVRLFYALQDVDKLYLILEYVQGGELFTHLAEERMFSEDTAAFYVAEMALALYHLHANVGVVYRDLKPENCLLDSNGHLVLTDFGLSKVSTGGDDKANTILGTPEYMAPEILLGKEYDYAVDWWSLGAVCYDLLTGNPPFLGNNNQRIIEKITKSKLNLPYYLSLDAKDLLTRLLRKDPRKRLGYQNFDVMKKHRFFRKINWDLLEKRHESIVPPIVPVITDPELAENFSAEFTEMALSPVNGGSRSSIGVGSNGAFQGFSFTASQSFLDSMRI